MSVSWLMKLKKSLFYWIIWVLSLCLWTWLFFNWEVRAKNASTTISQTQKLKTTKNSSTTKKSKKKNKKTSKKKTIKKENTNQQDENITSIADEFSSDVLNDENATIVGDKSNLAIVIFSPTNMQYSFNNDWYTFYEKDEKYWYKSTLIQPLAFLSKNANNELIFNFKVEHKGKIYFVKISQKYTPEIIRRGKIGIYIWPENLTEHDLPTAMQDGWWTLQTFDSEWLYVKTTTPTTVTIEWKSDVEAVILFPNLLWVRKYWSVIALWLILFFLSLAFLIYKKQVIRI